MKLPQGSVVVLTGASRGIGRATALLLAQFGRPPRIEVGRTQGIQSRRAIR